MVEKICGTPKETFLKVAEVVTSTGNAAASRHDHVRARLDAALDRRADDPHGRDAAAPARQRRPAGRRRQRAARPLEHPGRDRHGAARSRSCPATSRRPQAQLADAQGVPDDANIAEGARPVDELLAELSEVHGLAAEGLYGKAATKENDFGYAWLPKIDGNYSWMYIFDDMYRGNSDARGRQGARARGADHVRDEPGRHRAELAEDDRRALEAEVAGRRSRTTRSRRPTFWKAPKEYGGAGRFADPDRGLPASRRRPSPRRTARFTNSARWIQWKWKAVDPPGQAKTDQEILARIFLAVRELYRKEGGALPEAIFNVDWTYTNPAAPDLSEVPEGDQRQGARRPPRSRRTKTKSRSRRPASSSTASASSRTTARRCAATGSMSGCLHRGRQPDPAPQHRRSRAASGCTTTGPSPGRRIGASCTTAPRPTRTASRGIRPASGIKWNGEKWVGDVPDMKPDAPPGDVRRLHHAAGRASDSSSLPSRTTGRSPSTTRPSRRRSRTRCTRR